jgi:hypothetical protein
MTFPTPQESASMLIASIKHLIPASHATVAEILMAVSQHIDADRQAHCRHVQTTLPTAHPNASGPNTPGRAGGVKANIVLSVKAHDKSLPDNNL